MENESSENPDKKTTAWRWKNRSWLIVGAAYLAVCIAGVLIDVSFDAGPDIGIGTMLASFFALALLVVSVFTDRAWNVVRRIIWCVAVLPAWSVVFFVALFVVGLIGPWFVPVPLGDEYFLVVFDVVYQLSFAPFVAIALRRSTLFVERSAN